MVLEISKITMGKSERPKKAKMLEMQYIKT